jgi:hypothetical protein
MKRPSIMNSIVTGGVAAAAALGAALLSAPALAVAGLTPQSSGAVSFQTGGQYDALFDARSGWASGLQNQTWWFTMSASGGVGQCVFGYELDGIAQPGWTGTGPNCAPNPFSVPVDVAALSNGTHQITGVADINSGLPPQSPLDPPQWFQVSGSFSLSVDNTVPTVAVSQPQPGWVRGAATVAVSGATSGPSGIADLVCGGQSFAGSSTTLQFSATGESKGTCEAENGAGIMSAPAPYDVLVDNTPPSGIWQPVQWTSDPRHIVVDVADQGAGVAGGQIALRWPDGSLHNIPTTFDQQAGTLTGFVNDDQLAAGTYQATATVQDAVGNQTTVTDQVDGTPLFVPIPLRTPTVTLAGTSSRAVRRCTVRRVRLRPVKKHRRIVRDQKPRAKLIRSCSLTMLPVSRGPLKLAFGQQGSIAGVVETGTGQPLSRVPVDVSAQAPDGSSHPVETVTTNANGGFSYTVATGSSRLVSFAFPGTATLRDSSASSRVLVAPEAVLHGPRHARTGQTITLTGFLAGGPFPSSGVLGELEVKYFGHWTQFGAATTSRRGRWRVRYGLDNTPRSWHTPYPFRICLTKQAAYPYWLAPAPASQGAVTRACTNTVTVKIN